MRPDVRRPHSPTTSSFANHDISAPIAFPPTRSASQHFSLNHWSASLLAPLLALSIIQLFSVIKVPFNKPSHSDSSGGRAPRRHFHFFSTSMRLWSRTTTRDDTFTSSEGIQRYPKVSNAQIAMTENLPANNTGDRNKKILREILYQAYVLLVTHNFGQKYILYTFQNC